MLVIVTVQTMLNTNPLSSMYETAPITNRGRDESLLIPAATLTRKWARLWTSIALSCIGGTLFPYSTYLRVLDLGDLIYLFDDAQFSGKLLKEFFANLRTAVGVDTSTSTKSSSQDTFGPKNGSNPKRGWDTKPDVQRLGDLITQHAPLVEELDGTLDGALLHSWIPRLQKLTRLSLFNGAALATCGQLLSSSCPAFKTVVIYNWADAATLESADPEFAGFLRDLRPQSLEHVQVIGRAEFGALAFGALSETQGESIRELYLNDLPTEAVAELSLLKGCTALTTLQLSEAIKRTDLSRSHEGVFEEVVEWLRNCKNLTCIKFNQFLPGAAILTPLLREKALNLTELELMGYNPLDAPAFYDGLPSQAETLRELMLQSETDEDQERLWGLVSAVCRLRRLTSLNLKSISDFFRDEHYIQIASSLRQLEELWLSGWGTSDKIFEALAGLHSLKRVNIDAYSEFTREVSPDYAEVGECFELTNCRVYSNTSHN